MMTIHYSAIRPFRTPSPCASSRQHTNLHLGPVEGVKLLQHRKAHHSCAYESGERAVCWRREYYVGRPDVYDGDVGVHFHHTSVRLAPPVCLEGTRGYRRRDHCPV